MKRRIPYFGSPPVIQAGIQLVLIDVPTCKRVPH